MKRQVRLCVLVCWVFCFVSCGRSINRTAEQRLTEVLPGLLGSARQYRVHIDGAVEGIRAGRLAHVAIDSDDLQLTNGLLLDHLHLDLFHVDYDTNRRLLRHIDSATFEATIGQNSLDESLAGEEPPGESLNKIQVRLLADNRVEIDAERETQGSGVPFQIAGPLRLAGPTRIEIDPTRFKAVGIPTTGIVPQFLKSHFESAIDLSSLPFPIQLKSVATAPGTLTIGGIADVTELASRSESQVTP